MAHSEAVSTFAYTTTPENFIGAITETSDATAVYPPVSSQTATYSNLNQLTNLSGQGLTYDAVGNLISDGQRTYAWDAENRLVLITYPGQPGKQTAFAYDGLGRRRTIASTPPGGGSATTTAYLWCGEDICQSRDGSNTPIRSYYAEGEYVPGTPASLYYGIDQIGSVRRVFASTTSAPAYGYDPYGLPLQATAPLTDFVYGGMFYDADSGLYLTNYRAYDPVACRWLSRDPVGERTDVAASLYPYAGGNPVSAIDPDGRMPWPPMMGSPKLPNMPSIPLPDGGMMACALYGMCPPPSAPAPNTWGTCPKPPSTKPDCPAGMCMSTDGEGDKPKLEADKQGKHIPGHKNYIPGRSPFTHENPQGLLDKYAGKGEQVGNVPRGQPGFKERVDFGETIGSVDGKPTTKGIIHHSKRGAHIVPSKP